MAQCISVPPIVLVHSLTRLLLEERPIDLLPVGGAHPGGAGHRFPLCVQTGHAEQVPKGPSIETTQVKHSFQ